MLTFAGPSELQVVRESMLLNTPAPYVAAYIVVGVCGSIATAVTLELGGPCEYAGVPLARARLIVTARGHRNALTLFNVGYLSRRIIRKQLSRTLLRKVVWQEDPGNRQVRAHALKCAYALETEDFKQAVIWARIPRSPVIQVPHDRG
jgi:hypothetical protein